MIIRSFEVRNYKGFREQQYIELAPLTLFYGENSSGKSALLRLLPWISESMADNKRPGPILDGAVGREALWSDLAHINSHRHSIDVTVTWDEGHNANWAFRGGVLPETCELKAIKLVCSDSAWILEDDGDGSWQGQIPGVTGLLPTVEEAIWAQKVGCSRSQFRLDTQWLQGIRAAIPRVEKSLASPPGNLSCTGEGVARFLYQWARSAPTSKEANALRFVVDFFRELGFDLRIADVAPGYFRLDVAPLANPSALINLVDTGEGLTQVLAPLVAMARAANELGPRVVCLEQPELHLHTDAQRALANSIAAAAAAGAQILIETHSEVLLAATQLAIAVRPSRISANDVALYWVERREDPVSIAKRVPLNDKGQVGGSWPIDAFGDLLHLKNELLQAQRRAS
ncbi:AAA family ATPase [Vogesella sp. EB]|uniref:AAA family ATPase n=1 Tax=Vogesella sp. EB TaxID=1526735 RepID=UPI0009E308C3|nr:AAA family ATPase [Vogesella sp. EB]